jgi:peptidoglycan/xylan/chitin deacetylase (PgdA/CDA1 family)/glycosyltransferase involved in cell wall biosynthesis
MELTARRSRASAPALPSFSIVMPTYQRREVVCDAVRALAELDYGGAVEAVVVVDGSTDGTAAALGEIACPFPLRILEQANAGAAAARNRGAAEAGHEILLFLDDDMMCSPDILRHHARSHADGADAVVGHIPLDPASPPGILSRSVAHWAEKRERALRSGAPIGLFDLLTGQLSIRRELFAALGGFDPRFTCGGSFGDEDLDLGARLLENHVIRFNPQAVSRQRYVVTPQQHMRQWHDAGRADVAFARKHPRRAAELFALHGAARPLTRFVVRPLAAVPGIRRAIPALAAALAERAPTQEGLAWRWIARLFFLAREVGYWAGVRAAGGVPSSNRLVVLCYHTIADLAGDPVLRDYGIPAERFSRQLDHLIARGCRFVGAEEACAFLAGQAKLPRRAVLLTFDDCYAGLETVAREILAPRGIGAVVFAVTGKTSNEWDQPLGARRLALLDAEGLDELRGHGFEIGCHSRTHRPMPALGDIELESETRGAADDLERAGLPRPRLFAYPYGERDARAAGAVRTAGFAAAFGLRHGRAWAGSDPFDLPRVEILARDRGWRFRVKTAFPRLAAVLGA